MSYLNVFLSKRDILSPIKFVVHPVRYVRSLAEAWRKRRYKAAFVAKLSDSETEAAETQVWLKFAVKCQYLTPEQGGELYGTYNQILSGLVKMITHPEDWLLN